MFTRKLNIAPFSTRKFLFGDESVVEELADPLAEVESWIPFSPRPTIPVVAAAVWLTVPVTAPVVCVVVFTRPPTVLPTPPSKPPPPPDPLEPDADARDEPDTSDINESSIELRAATLVIETIEALNGDERPFP